MLFDHVHIFLTMFLFTKLLKFLEEISELFNALVAYLILGGMLFNALLCHACFVSLTLVYIITN